jgi:hypothetical protein
VERCWGMRTGRIFRNLLLDKRGMGWGWGRYRVGVWT